jgi:hypothetical protein
MNTDLIMDDNIVLILKNIQNRTEEMKKNNANKRYNIYKPNEKRHLGVEVTPLIRQSYETYNSENVNENENIINKIPYEAQEEETKL